MNGFLIMHLYSLLDYAIQMTVTIFVFPILKKFQSHNIGPGQLIP